MQITLVNKIRMAVTEYYSLGQKSTCCVR